MFFWEEKQWQLINRFLCKKIFLFYDARIEITCKKAIYKTRNTGMGNGMRGMQGTRGMFTRIPGNLLILAFRGMLTKIPGNVQEDSGECH